MKFKICLLFVIAFLGNSAFSQNKNEIAWAEAYKAEYYFELDSFSLALNGDGVYQGFLDIIRGYSGTEMCNAAHYYAGVCYIRLGQFESAIEELKQFKSKDPMVGAMAIALIGDAKMELGQMEDAIQKYLEAADYANNEFLSPKFLMKAGNTCELLDKYDQAYKIYSRIEKEYFYTPEQRIIERYISRVCSKTECIISENNLQPSNKQNIEPSDKVSNNKQTIIAKINRKAVQFVEFDEACRFHADFLMIAQQIYSLEPEEEEMIRNQAWKDILIKYLLEPYYEEVGISVSDAELVDLLYGSNIHYVILQNFTDLQTGSVDKQLIRSFFENADEDPRFSIISEYWKTIIKKDHLYTKYINMVAKGFYHPTALAKMDYEDKNSQVDFEYVFVPYKNIPDENFVVTESDLKQYYNNHKYMFVDNQASRDIEYVEFEIIPSAEDTLETLREVKNLYEGFKALESGHADYAKNFTEYINYDGFISEDELLSSLPQGFFNLEAGAITDIILDGSVYYFARIQEVGIRPDSVMASHIMLVPNDSVTVKDCWAKADSLMNLVKEGADFAELAMIYSEDPGSSQQGGDLGWFPDGIMVSEFNEACFRGKKGDLTIVETQFGVHLIKIADQTNPRRKISLAIVNKGIYYSQKVLEDRYQEAAAFAYENSTAEKFDEAIIKNNYHTQKATYISEFDNQINDIIYSREIVRWAYAEGTNKGDVSTVFSFPDKYIVAKVSAIREKGVLPLEDVEEIITPIVIKDKKAEKLIADLNKDITANTNLFAIAEKYGFEVETITNASFSSFSLPGIGIEPNLNAIASVIEINKISKPVKGNNGVYVIKVIKQLPAPAKTDFSLEQLSLMQNQSNQANKIFESVVKMAKIKDYRARYF